MTTERSQQPKWLLSGCQVSGAFGEFFDNPNPDVCCQKRKRISDLLQMVYLAELDGSKGGSHVGLGAPR